ncbi:MAG: DUF3180 domain-containing protein [Rhodoluna sp.]
MKTTRPIAIVALIVLGAVAAGFFGSFQVSHGHALPVSGISLTFTMLGVGVILAGLAYPIYRYRKQSLAFAKGLAKDGNLPSGSAARPKRLDPFYAVRVLALSKSVSFASALIAGWHFGLISLQLTTPVVTQGVWKNVGALVASIAAMGVALAVEQICKIPNGGAEDTDGGKSAPVEPTAA